MISCPKCGNSLPDWAQACQFCGTDTKKVARPAAPKGSSRSVPVGQPTWVWPAYYLIAAYFIISGFLSIGLAVLMNKEGLDVGDIVTLIVSGITAVIGIGLAAKVEIIRGITNIFCWLQILSGGFGFLTLLFAGAFLGPIAILYAGFKLFDVISGAFMIFLIGETD